MVCLWAIFAEWRQFYGCTHLSLDYSSESHLGQDQIVQTSTLQGSLSNAVLRLTFQSVCFSAIVLILCHQGHTLCHRRPRYLLIDCYISWSLVTCNVVVHSSCMCTLSAVLYILTIKNMKIRKKISICLYYSKDPNIGIGLNKRIVQTILVKK